MKTVEDLISEMIGAADKMLASHIADVRKSLAEKPEALHRYLTEVNHCGSQWESAAKMLAFWTDRVLHAENLLTQEKK